ncbi:trehalose-phosphatase [Azospirillum agricola]|uniref:trehalose-phosphatase n=1 Tax=Azospirillum agricola TaxID=1720247 RepID=UPI000A0F24D7|nr:trehalose-phosphatase [Azospirillum agricola]SMH54065.1 trehalose 6-phosphate phosphatase [Azospirillum lipoferum]
MQSAPPSALAEFDAFLAVLGDRRPALFLDYDGTLAPIAPRPELAVFDGEARAVVRRLSALCTVAFVSGRDLDDLAAMVGVEGLVYAGSHGFDIRGPELRTQVGLEYLPDLDAAESGLRSRLGETLAAGVLIERKRFAIAIHTRQADPAVKPRVADTVRALAAERPRLRVTGGKELLELRPNLPWDKGRAVLALLDALGLREAGTLPLYLGDDETDEDAFRALAGFGLGIRVMDPPAPTAATWSLRDPAEAAAFLGRLADRLAKG